MNSGAQPARLILVRHRETDANVRHRLQGHMVGFTVRFFPQYIHAKARVAAGDLGTLASIFARRTNVITQADRIQGRTGVMFFLGIHDFDAMRWIVGAEPVSVYCEAATSLPSKYPIENETFSIIRFANGVVGCAHIGWTMPANHPAGFDFRLDVTGDQGVLNLGMMQQGVAVYTTKGAQYPTMADPLFAKDKAFVDAVLDDGPVPVSGHDGLVAVRMVNAALAVVVGGAITRPQEITRRFAAALQEPPPGD